MKWGALTFLTLTGMLCAQTPPTAPAKSRVLCLERPAVVNKFAIDAAGVRTMFIQALLQFTGKKTVAAAWKEGLGLKPNDVVGLKINAAGGPVMSTRRALVDAVVETLVGAGLSPQQIIIWDKFEDDLLNAGYLPNREGRVGTVHAVVPETRFDEKLFYVNEILGKLIWGDELFQGRRPTKEDLLRAAEALVKKKNKDPEVAASDQVSIEEQTSNKSYFARLLTQTCTKIINLPIMIDNNSVGLMGCQASLALGSVDNTRRFQGEGTYGDPAITEILDRDLFRKKVVLHIMDGLIAEYAGGPQFAPQYTQSIGALYLSTDPVAIDSLVLARLEEWRKANLVVPIGTAARHITTSAQSGLGQAERKQIDLITLP